MHRISEMVACAPVEVQTRLHSNESRTTDGLTLFPCLDNPTSVPHTSIVASHKLFSQLHWLLHHSQHLSLSLSVSFCVCQLCMFLLSQLVMPLNADAAPLHYTRLPSKSAHWFALYPVLSAADVTTACRAICVWNS
jgi:hypothetical protein